MKNFRELRVWEKAHQWVLDVYRATGAFPREERFGLVAQHRRAAASVPAIIAEGRGRSWPRERARFPITAAGSACVAEDHLILARDLGCLKEEDHRQLDQQINERKRMLNSFTQKLTTGSGQLTPKA